ncbi:hypothetical protein ACFC14_02255 [Microbacterium sp. NPDC055988]|uniref:hypothetical protein n=1 Tax=Microbacterium sp. NPDC055988 TaxID=3345671 RepID=UPI0035D5E40A
MTDTHGSQRADAGLFSEKTDTPKVAVPQRPQAHVVATTATDDAAYVALADLSTLLEGREETMIVGGHMVSLICAAFPSRGLVERRTGDADAGIPIELADTGELHDALLDLGYVTDGAANRYIKGMQEPQPTIDLLIPSHNGRFGDEKKGGRAFNTMPGLVLAMNPRIEIDVHITHRDGSERSTVVVVPGIEAAIVLKAIAWYDRRFQTDKDAVDLSNLFAVLDTHGADALGGWRLKEAGLTASRHDAALHLHRLADAWEAKPPKARVDARALVSRIRTHVTQP